MASIERFTHELREPLQDFFLVFGENIARPSVRYTESANIQ